MPGALFIKQQKDGSITIVLNPQTPSLLVVDKIVSFFKEKEQEYIETPKYSFKVEPRIRAELMQWALAFEGCLALLLASDPGVKELINPTWQFINSKTGGLYLEPFTLFLYEDHPKIIHPITVANYDARKTIEQKNSGHN